MRSPLPTLLLVLAGTLAGCGPVPSTPVWGQARHSLVGGTMTDRFPAVAAVVAGSRVFCSGTLVAPQVVLTAAHCATESLLSDGFVHFGPSASRPDQRIGIVRVEVHPQAAAGGPDVALLRLRWSPLGVVPLALAAKSWSWSDVGRALVHVGFGVTDVAQPQTAGWKREVTTQVRQVLEVELEAGGSGVHTCTGDSGGAALLERDDGSFELGGVISHGDAACAKTSFDVRSDAFGDWMSTTAAPWQEASCSDDGWCAAGCEADPDCACLADGACTTACAELAKDPDCPADCGADLSCAQEACPRVDPDCLVDGSPCSSAEDCAGGVCSSNAEGASVFGYCSRPCSATQPCVTSMTCDQSTCRFTPEDGGTTAPIPTNPSPSVPSSGEGSTYVAGTGTRVVGQRRTGCDAAPASPWWLLSWVFVARRLRTSGDKNFPPPHGESTVA